MADKLTLASFGVDMDALARRIDTRQAELARDDDACAQLAGVTAERWQAWKKGTERPGLARVPKLSVALSIDAEWILYGTATIGAETPAEPSTADARRVVDIMTRLAPAVETVEKLAEEIARLNLPIPGGFRMGVSLAQAGGTLQRSDAVTLSEPPQ